MGAKLPVADEVAQWVIRLARTSLALIGIHRLSTWAGAIRSAAIAMCAREQGVISMLQTLLIGPVPDAATHRQSGIGPFIQFLLRYPALLVRLGAGLVVWRACSWLQWTNLAGLGFLTIEIYASLLLIRILADLLQFRQFGRFLTAVWPPVTVIGAAGYLLFFNDQGRELGVGLMDLNHKGLYLGLALVYWALNNWLSARVGLAATFPAPEKDQTLLFWGPRILGVCAHFLAACSLAVAAWKQPDSQGGLWLVVAAPVAIVLATSFTWLLDKGYLSQRYRHDERRLAQKLMYGVAAIELLLLGGLLYAVVTGEQPGLSSAALWIAASALLFLILISVLRRKAPLGPNATPEVRKQDQQAERRLTARFTCVLALLMFCSTVAIWIWPMHIGQFFGSLTITCFSFGAFLALANFLGFLAGLLTEHARKAGFEVQPRAMWVVLLCFLVVPALLASLTHPFHRVRICKDQECTAVAAAGWSAVETPDQRPTAAEAARAWYAQAAPAYHALHPDEPVPMLIVATAGGGIRAAYWTATVLERLERDLRWDKLSHSSADKPPTENLLHNLLFAISGVSGGSVGAAAYAAAVHDHEVSGSNIKPTVYLQKDFLAPGLASLVFIDGPANLLPDFGQIDRGSALELGFEAASRTEKDKDGLVSHKFLSFLPTMSEVGRMKSWRPLLLLNATHQETGRRIITSHIKIERNDFLDSYDALQVLEADVRLSTAAHNSARFTYVSPAGDLIGATEPLRNKGYVIDGGYYENYGAETALELARTAVQAINESEPKGVNKVKLVVLQISSDPTLKEDRTLVRVIPPDSSHACTVNTFGRPGPDNYLILTKDEGEEGYVLSYANELSAPLVGIMSVREAHGTVDAEELAAASCTEKNKAEPISKALWKLDMARSTVGNAGPAATSSNEASHFSHLAMCEKSWNGGEGINPPLGWVLSAQTRSKFKDILKDCGNKQELSTLEEALGFPTSK